jgi:hypothetical protein
MVLPEKVRSALVDRFHAIKTMAFLENKNHRRLPMEG